jgi:hypothetical protein
MAPIRPAGSVAESAQYRHFLSEIQTLAGLFQELPKKPPGRCRPGWRARGSCAGA